MMISGMTSRGISFDCMNNYRFHRSSTQHSGFTLIELLLYIGLTSTIVFVVSGFFLLIGQVRVRSATLSEVDQQGTYALQHITQVIRNAQNVTAPPIGTSAPALSLEVPDVGKNPTVFSTLGGVLYVSEGGGSNIPLTSTRVTVTDLTVTNLSRSGTSRTVRVSLTLAYNNTVGRSEYDYQTTLLATAGVRP